MNSSINNTQRTTDQGSLPSIEDFRKQYPNTIVGGSDKSYVTQECPPFLVDGNGTINKSALMGLPTSNPSGSHIYPTNTNVRQNDTSPMASREQFDHTKLKQIQIKFQPRGKYHPRTPKESEKVAHYIRCETGEREEYPTIYTPVDWGIQSKCNYIEVALVDIFDQLHPYIIDNKERNSSEGEQLIVRGNDGVSNILYFCLTDEDFNSGCKTFQIELIKSKQDDNITKNLIRERQLEKSKLRFTRTYFDDNSAYHRDEASTVYSSVMTECYGGVAVEHVNPEFGPMGHNQLLDVVFTGLKAKDKGKLSFKILEETADWIHDMKDFDATGNAIHFRMPAFRFPRTDNVKASVNVYYEGQEIFKSPYVYVVGLDSILDSYKLNNPAQDDVDSTKLNSSDGSNQNLASNSCSSSIVPKKTPKNKPRKRRHED